MKKFLLSLITLLMILAFYPMEANAKASDNAKNESVEEASAAEQAQVMIDRLYDIRSMDIKNIDSPEKEKLRHEVMTIKDKLQQLSGGIYISAGALIIIIILLILL